MDTYTVGLREVGRGDLARVGGKAANLGEMIQRGYPVPPGFVITTAAYERFHAADSLPPDIATAYRELGAPAVAVRSSGSAEDLAELSFAGQYDSYLNVSGEESVLAAVRDCWASLSSPRAVDYRRQHGRSENGAMAVVVQTMVDAEWAGVLCTADPVSGRRDRMIIEAVPGLGDALVSGTVTGLRHVVDKATGQVLSGPSALPAGALEQLADLGARLEDAFGCPQDVEWAFAQGRCRLVQTRALTALPEDRRARLAEDRRRRGQGRLKDIMLVAAEHAPVPPYPMDASLFLRPAIRAALETLRSAGFATPEVDDVVTGVEEGAIVIAPPRIRPTPRTVIGVPAMLPRAARLVLRAKPAAWLAQCHATLVPLAGHIDGEELAALSDQELIDNMEALRAATGRLFPARFACFPRGRLADKALQRCLRLVVGSQQAGRLHADLLSSVPCITWEANQELRRLAATIHASAALRAIYSETPAAQIPDRLGGSAQGRVLLGQVDDYLSRYGYWKTSTPSVGLSALRDIPHAVHGQLAGLSGLDGARHDPSARLEQARSELIGRGLRKRIFGSLAGRLAVPARDFVGFREDSHYHLYAVFAVARRYVLELGGRLVERGVLGAPDDIMYLELTEAIALPGDAARRIVARRRAARTAGMDEYVDITSELAQRSNSDGVVHGTPASPGTAVGQVRVIREESEFAKLRPGDILVCPYTNPAWTPLFGSASAVVADAGGTTSHSAIVAREYGIPAVMGTGNATAVLADGQWVIVQGEAGTVTLTDPPGQGWAVSSPAMPASR